MNVNELKLKVTFKDLFNKFSQEQIMEYYFGEYIRLNRSYTNPFRKDQSPSCRFFYKEGKLLFNDFAASRVFDCFDIAAQRVGQPITPGEILQEMSTLTKENVPRPQIKYRKEFDQAKDTVIKVEITPFLEKDYQFWNQFNIGVETLKKFNVRKVNRSWINGRLVYIATPSDPCYRYIEGDRIKLYRPTNIKYKFRNNYNIILEGVNFLPKTGEYLILTKAMKDVMVLSTLGLPAICPTSESRLIEPEHLMPFFERFKYIVVWYDADEVGNHMADIMYEKYKEFGLVKLEHNIKLGKDVSDIVKAHGITKLEELCKQSGIL